MAHISAIPVFADTNARDAISGWEEGDLCYVIGTGLMWYAGDASWHTFADAADLA